MPRAPSHTSFERPKPAYHLPGFDGLRAIAILLVILWHVTLQSGFPEQALGIWRPLAMTGWAGVDLFFALSGFLITHLICREEAAHAAVTDKQTFSIRGFYIRRALRILPVFYAVFVINTLVLAQAPAVFPSVRARAVLDSNSAMGLWPYATFWGNYLIGYWQDFSIKTTHPGNAYLVYWSLCVEEHFYLLWPILLWVIKPRRMRISLALAACVLLCGMRAVARAEDWMGPNAIHCLSHYRVDAILWGAIGALIWDQPWLTPRRRRVVMGICLPALLWLVLTKQTSVIPPPSALGISLGFTLLSIVSTLVLIELATHQNSTITTVLEMRPIRWLGRLSYILYLIHFQVIDIGRRAFFTVQREGFIDELFLFFMFCVILALPVALALHFAIERPFLRLKQRFGKSARLG